MFVAGRVCVRIVLQSGRAVGPAKLRRSGAHKSQLLRARVDSLLLVGFVCWCNWVELCVNSRCLLDSNTTGCTTTFACNVQELRLSRRHYATRIFGRRANEMSCHKRPVIGRRDACTRCVTQSLSRGTLLGWVLQQRGGELGGSRRAELSTMR